MNDTVIVGDNDIQHLVLMTNLVIDKALIGCGSLNVFPAQEMMNILLDIRVLLHAIKESSLKEIGLKLDKSKSE